MSYQNSKFPVQAQIAIDGPAASGKSTVAKLIAQKLGGFYVNTGEMFRAISWACRQAGIDPDQHPDQLAEALKGWKLECRPAEGEGRTLEQWFNGKRMETAAIRAPEVATIVSQVARIPAVRDYVMNWERACVSLGVIVMEGRDIGTVVFPQALCKFFVTATPMERARRRFAQKGEVRPGETLESVAEDIARRDEIDSTRKTAPLKAADDAVTLVTDGMTPDQVAERIVHEFQLRYAALCGQKGRAGDC